MIDIPTWAEFTDFVVTQIKTNDFFAAAGFFSALGLVWNYTKKYPIMLWGRIKRKITFTVHIYETDEFYNYFENWLFVNHKKSYRNVEVELRENDQHSPIASADDPEKDQEESVKYKQLLDLFYIRRGLRWIKIYKGRDKLENANSLKSVYLNRFELTGIFSKKAIMKLIEEAKVYNIELNKSRKETKVRIYVNRWDNWNRMNDVQPKTLDKIIIEGKDELVEDIEKFYNSRKWYEERSILHKRGVLLFGSPGGGKTALCMGLAKHFKKNLYFLNPTNTTDENLTALYSNLAPKSILVIEDIDAIFNNQREKEDDSVKFNFSTLLNCLDGAFSKEGIVTIFTTNHPERLDEALIRAGRMDYKLEVKHPSKESIESYMNIFFNMDNSFVELYSKNTTLPMVDIQDICIRNKSSYSDAKRAIEEKLNNKLKKVVNN